MSDLAKELQAMTDALRGITCKEARQSAAAARAVKTGRMPGGWKTRSTKKKPKKNEG